MQKNLNNLKYKRGVENLLVLPVEFEYNDFIYKSNKIEDDGYGGGKTIEIKSLDKTKLCNHLCNDKTSTEQYDMFVNIFY